MLPYSPALVSVDKNNISAFTFLLENYWMICKVGWVIFSTILSTTPAQEEIKIRTKKAKWNVNDNCFLSAAFNLQPGNAEFDMNFYTIIWSQP